MSKNLDYFSSESVEKILRKLKTSKRGLSPGEVRARQKKYGRNVISEKKEIGVILEFLSHFNNPLVIILLVAASVSAYLGEVKNFVVIAVMVIAGVVLDFIEEHSANNAAKKLREKVSITATVIRGGKKEEIKSSDVCIGDIIFLSSGNLVPADARIIQADDCFVNQSALTGESFPGEKFAEALEDANASDVSKGNILFLGSSIVSGTATAVVYEIGKETEFGKIATSILEKEDKSEFELGIVKFGFLIMKIIMAIVLVIFLANAMVHRDVLESFIFAVAIAVGVTPELLPVIMSITMARSSKRMSKAGVIVKKLSSIPNFGSMDILCTDKTGTLTEDTITLITYTDLAGKHNEDVFLYTYLNSVYQTGVKNPLDKAVLEYKKADVTGYKKTEEIPFDFVRKMMSIAVMGPKGRILITKGAPEEVLKNCSTYIKGGSSHTLTDAIRLRAIKYYEALSSQGYRVLAVAAKSDLPEKDNYTVADERGLTFSGFVSFLDPAKKDVSGVLAKLQAHGVEVKVITGDNELVTKKICLDVGLKVRGVMIGKEIGVLSDDALAVRAEKTTIFARFSPDQKQRVVAVLRKRKHVVGYMGDGINDAPSLKIADVGISVDNAVDIAKETADIILTRKALAPILEGVIEGRRAFGNTMKYIMMGLSSNFGNMFSVIGAIFYIPFLPMLPIQILLNNFIYDFSQVTIPWDKVDADWLKKPRRWNLGFIKKFMLIFGPISSIFDLATFFILFSVFHLGESAFQTGWFMESLATQALVIHIIRTHQLPFVQSRASILLTITTVGAVAIGWLIPYTPLGAVFNFTPPPIHVLFVIAGLVAAYLVLVEIVKRIFYKKYQF